MEDTGGVTVVLGGCGCSDAGGIGRLAFWPGTGGPAGVSGSTGAGEGCGITCCGMDRSGTVEAGAAGTGSGIAVGCSCGVTETVSCTGEAPGGCCVGSCGNGAASAGTGCAGTGSAGFTGSGLGVGAGAAAAGVSDGAGTDAEGGVAG